MEGGQRLVGRLSFDIWVTETRHRAQLMPTGQGLGDGAATQLIEKLSKKG